MNKHDFKERPLFSQELWDSFDVHYLMGGMGDDTSELIAELYVRGFEPKEIIFCDSHKLITDSGLSNVSVFLRITTFDHFFSSHHFCK